MEFCVFFLCFWILNERSHAYPSDNSEAIKTLPDHVVRMGEGLEAIPLGEPHVISVNLAYNYLTVLPPHVFHHKRYKNLTRIELHQNKIRAITHGAFKELKQLRSVDLSNNNLTMLDANTFRQNTRLEKLDLSNNKLAFEREKLFLCSHSLETLILSDNKIDQIFDSTFLRLPNLRNLMMDNNMVVYVASHSFESLRHLQYLSLANTGVYRLSNAMFHNAPRIIDLSDTPLAKKFDPPLKKVKNDAVATLINIDNIFS